MIKNFIKKINNLIKRIIFKLKGYKTGFSTKKFSSLEEIVNLQTYENLDLINYTFTNFLYYWEAYHNSRNHPKDSRHIQE